MRRFKAIIFCHLGMILENFMWDKPGSGASLSPAPPLDEQTCTILHALIGSLEEGLREIELCDSASTCALIKARITLRNLNRAHLDGLLGELHRNVTREANAHIFLEIEKDKTTFYKPISLLSEITRMRFPDSDRELRSAATSYAVGLSTACVFYSMRSLEKPIHALARNLRVKLSKHTELETWGNIHREITSKVESLRKLRHTKARDEQLRFYSNAGIEFGYLKDAWRNYVSHGRKSYEPMEALIALQHSMSFVEGLAPNLQERLSRI